MYKRQDPTIVGIPWRGGHGQAAAGLLIRDAKAFSACAAAALYARESFQREGGFDETFFCYLEDVDLGFRLRLSGESCVNLGEAVVALRFGDLRPQQRLHAVPLLPQSAVAPHL